MTEYEPNAIVHSYITDYIRRSLSENTGILKGLEEYARKNDVPIVQPETAKLILDLAYIRRPQRILEVGCAIGYSAILLSRALDMGGSITTLEYNSEMAKLARENIEKAGLTDVITVVEADAREYLSYIDKDECFDYIFLDGPKAHYIYMLDECVRLLTERGVLVSDNILYKGMTASDELVKRRKITIVKRLRAYVKALTAHPELETSILSVGDGVTVSVKKRKEVF